MKLSIPHYSPFWKQRATISLTPWLYDRLPIDLSASPNEQQALDELAQVSLKTVALPNLLLSKIITILRDFGKKKDFESFSKDFFRKLSSRSCVETPRVLGSCLLPEKKEGEKTISERMAGFGGVAEVVDSFRESGGTVSAADLLDGIARSAAASDQFNKNFQVVYSPEVSLAFLAHRFGASYGAHLRVLTELKKRIPGFSPKTVVDYGAGHGVGGLVVNRIWGESLITFVEPSANMSRIGKYMTSDMKGTWQTALHSGVFDLVLVSYVLLEMRTQDQRDTLIRDLWRKLDINGVLVVIEKGTPSGFRLIHRVREIFLELSAKSPNFHFVAPCPHESVCPLALTGRDWCHFSQPVERIPHEVFSKGAKSQSIDHEKFSYLVIRKGPGPRDKLNSENDAKSAEDKSFFWPRVVMPPIKASGHTLIDVCASPNSFERLVVNRSKPHGSGYRPSRDLIWGDLWRYPKRLSRRDARDYVPENVKGFIARAKKVADNDDGTSEN